MSIRDEFVHVIAEGYQDTVGSEHTETVDWYDEANRMADRLLARFLIIDAEDAEMRECGARCMADSVDGTETGWTDWLPEVELFFKAMRRVLNVR